MIILAILRALKSSATCTCMLSADTLSHGRYCRRLTNHSHLKASKTLFSSQQFTWIRRILFATLSKAILDQWILRKWNMNVSAHLYMQPSEADTATLSISFWSLGLTSIKSPFCGMLFTKAVRILPAWWCSHNMGWIHLTEHSRRQLWKQYSTIILHWPGLF